MAFFSQDVYLLILPSPVCLLLTYAKLFALGHLVENSSLPHRTVAAEVRKQIAGQYGSPQLLKNLNVGTAASNTVGTCTLDMNPFSILHYKHVNSYLLYASLHWNSVLNLFIYLRLFLRAIFPIVEVDGCQFIKSIICGVCLGHQQQPIRCTQVANALPHQHLHN